MEQERTTLTPIDKCKVMLHPYFSISECTYVSDGRGVIYSPFVGETLLCDPSLVDYLVQLDAEPELSYKRLLKKHPTKAKSIIQQLADLHIIEIHG